MENYIANQTICFFMVIAKGEILPSSAIVLHRLPHVSPDCKFCGDLESPKHLFFECPRAAAIWFNSPLNLRSIMLMGSSIVDCWEALMQPVDNHPDGNDIAQLVIVINSALSHHQSFKEAQFSADNRRIIHTSDHYSWIPPPTNVLKVNFDVAVDGKHGKGASAAIFTDHSGKIRDWCCRVHYHQTDPLILESLALREAVQFVVIKGYSKVIFEGDCQTLINNIHCRHPSTDIGNIVHDIRELSKKLQLASFIVVKRSCNRLFMI
ncbi:uncharacterized protein LOC110664151 [Hevea brasiliensis]|uniref:uncharacterized protein LOC110664151 n=1 Tax=Hevea brasiliensis TaxID=3981 RepID=UPI0025D3D288|nr:uncharacterized protein LOC110664151 [Hevea brasiliensis]